MIQSRIALLLAHLVGNAFILWLGYLWLGMGESDSRHLWESAGLILFLVAATVWLHGTALVHFEGQGLSRAVGKSARNILPLIVFSMVTLAIYGGLVWLGQHYGLAAYDIGSAATMTLKHPLAPRTVGKFFEVVLWLLRWLVVPALLLPIASGVALEGWQGWRWARKPRNPRVVYWLEVVALLLCAIWVPFKLFFWVPKIDAFGGQMISFVARAGTAYLLFVISLLALEFFTSSGKPRETQSTTVVSP
jgi:hypothetical protein